MRADSSGGDAARTAGLDSSGAAVILLAALLAAGTAASWSSGDPAVFLTDAARTPPPPLRAGPLDAEGPPWPAADRLGRAEAPLRAAKLTPPEHRRSQLDLNRADATALQGLPGVGPGLARRVVAYREVHGPFRRIEELLQVPGIGPKRWERIRPLLRLGEAP